MVVYRPAGPGDAEAVARLHATSWREHYRGSFRDEFLDGDLVAERRAVWRRRLGEPPSDQLVLLALDGDALAGFVCAYGAHDREWGSFIDNLHVAGAHQRRGIGVSLMRQAGAWLAERYPDDGVYLLVLEANTAARRFYERLGAANARVSSMETHGGAWVRSCHYTWPSPAQLAAR